MDNLEKILHTLIQKSLMSARFPHGIVHPHRDWAIALSLAVILSVAFVAVGGLFFVAVGDEGALFGDSSGRFSVSINRENLMETVATYEEKKEVLKVLKTRKPSIGQP